MYKLHKVYHINIKNSQRFKLKHHKYEVERIIAVAVLCLVKLLRKTHKQAGGENNIKKKNTKYKIQKNKIQKYKKKIKNKK